MAQEPMAGQESVDPITEVQQQIDSEQGQDAALSPFTTEQETAVRAMMAQQAKTYEGQLAAVNKQLSGFTGRLDATRNEMKGIAQQASGVLRSDMSFEQIVAGMTEEERAALTAWRDADRKVSTPGQPAQEAADPRWEQIYMMAESMGLDRNDSNINYGVLENMSMTDAQRQSTFMASLAAAVQAKGSTVAPPPVPPTTPPGEDNPPIDRGASGAGRAGRPQTEDYLMTEHIEGRMPTDVYKERMAAIGHPVG